MRATNSGTKVGGGKREPHAQAGAQRHRIQHRQPIPAACHCRRQPRRNARSTSEFRFPLVDASPEQCDHTAALRLADYSLQMLMCNAAVVIN